MKKIFLLVVFCTANICLFAQSDYNLEEVKGKLNSIGLINIETDETEAFANSMLWVVKHSESIEKLFVSRDYNTRQFAAKINIPNSQDDSRTLNCVLRITVGDGQLSILLTDISIQNAVVKIPVPIEIYYPAKKTKQEECLEFAKMAINENMSDLTNFVQTNRIVLTDHWLSMKENKVIKGMSADECTILKGNPSMVRNNGEKTQWMLEDGSTIVFENNIVIAIL